MDKDVFMNRLPPLYALRAFEKSAMLRSFTLAAQSLNITQSAVSKHIKHLEEHFNCRLFIRAKNQLTLTLKGQQLADELHHAFRLLENACQTLTEQSDILRLKSPISVMMSWLLDCLAEYKKQQYKPEIQASSIWMDIDAVDFLTEPFDCAIILSDGNFQAGINGLPLFQEYLVPICSPELLDSIVSAPQSLSVIHTSTDKRDWRRWTKATQHPIEHQMRGESIFDALEQAMRAAIAGHGVAIGDLTLCSNAIQRNELVVPINQPIHTGDSYYLVYPQDSNKKEMITQFHQFLVKAIPKNPLL